ncbi:MULTISPECIES: hypothetical protein [Dyella]|uniref:Uncharacterized protein n=2 Tax=Dyella TaxID=231454 RepID=A0A4R0YMY8_9GAMM|nr:MULTISPECIES: hypothetical protein [Dyella]TBR37234.1 hypothetical protein EYV96_15250 [Dyella terrae]TCI07676.1 hypothetical protein EZM97_23620 [Dyella soli]
MKTLFAAAVLLLAPVASHAACSAADFSIEGFKMKATGNGAGQRLSLAGQLVNHCKEPAAAQVRIEAKDASGKVLQTKQAWPAGTANISPGQTADFDLGRLFRYESDVQDFTVSVADVRTW